MTYLQSDRQRYYASDEWAAKRRACLDYYGWNCSVCDQDWRARGDVLQCHHLPSGYEHLGHEDIVHDLRPLCGKHHRKGQMPLSVIREMRRAYVWDKRFRRFSSWLWVGLKAILKLAWRGVKWLCRGRRTAA